MGSKYRMTEKECEKKLEEYLDQVIPTINLDTSKWDTSKKRNYEEAIDKYFKPWHADVKEKFLAAGEILKKDVDNWANFSLATDRDPEEIMLRLLLDHYYCNDPGATVCIAYLGNNVLLDEEFVKDVIYITSGFFNFEDWDDEHVTAVNKAALSTDEKDAIKILKKLYTEGEIKKVFGKAKNSIKITFPVDSSAIKYSEEFRHLYNDYIRFVSSPMYE